MKKSTLFHRDFTIMVIGQIISLFGNSILRFSLSLYVLDKTGSAAAFGGILALSMIPTVLLSPFGGVLADRVNRRNIMVALDFTTAALIALFTSFFLNETSLVPLTVIMMALSVIQALYQPSVQSSIPSLTEDKYLEQANGTVMQVNALANLVGPILGGFLYGFLPIRAILFGSGVCFFISAVMELFLHIPFTRQAKAGGLIGTVKTDLSGAWRFLAHENPKMLQLLGVMAMLNLVLASLIMVGLPYMVRIFLGLSAQYNGFAEGALAVGTILGGLLSGLFAKRISFRRSGILLMVCAVVLFPMGLALVTNSRPYISYGVVLLCVLVCMCFSTLFSIFAQTYAQRQTPSHLLGKVAAFITMLCMCAVPIGQAIYGFLMERFKNHLFIILLCVGVISVLLALATGWVLKSLPEEEGASAGEIVKNV